MSVDALAPADTAGAAERPRRDFLTFRLGPETYGVDILKVQEIREVDRVTRVPHVPPYLRGVINLRGAIVPIVDLGLMLGFREALPVEHANAIVLNAEGRLTGLVVGAVSDVVALSEEEIRTAPDLGDRGARSISGIGVRDEGSILLLDVAHLLGRIREERA
jgi:purine-binding chemotaxis protein CheW